MLSPAKKKIVKLCIGIFYFFLLCGTVTAQTEFVPLAPLPGTTADCNGKQCISTATYLPGIFRLGVGVASALAVLAIAYGGIKYMISDVVTSKSDAIQTIKNALLGLALALSAYLILFTINPDLVETSFSDIQNQNALPIRAPVTQTGPAGYKITFYAAQYSLTYQEYECEIFWSTPGQAGTTRQRYAYDVPCEVAKNAKQFILLQTYEATGAPIVQMRKVKAYSNGPSYGTPLTNSANYTEKQPQTLGKGELTVCKSDEALLSDTPQERYQYVITQPSCTKTQSGNPTTNTYSVSISGSASASLKSCRDFQATIPNAVVTEECVPYYNTQ